jgi:hypothetical protein
MSRSARHDARLCNHTTHITFRTARFSWAPVRRACYDERVRKDNGSTSPSEP